jgi:type I protein arginine methyltransferase
MATSDLLLFHAFCLTDTGTRLGNFARALTALVRPGDTVLDLGAGTGLLSFLARRAGAARVYAVEESDASAFGALLAEANGLTGGIEFIPASSSQVTLGGERVDLIVGDICDTFGLQAGGLSSFIDARDRLLKPGGQLIPRAYVLHVAPVDAPELYARTVGVWSGAVEGVDLSPLRLLAVNQVYPGRFDLDHLLAPPGPFATIDLATASTPHVGGTITTTVTRAGTMHGLCGAFVATLADDVTIGNLPGSTGSTNFAHAFLPIDAPVDVAPGDTISIAVQTFDSIETRWRVEVRHEGAGAHARFDHSTFAGQPLSMARLRKQANGYRPALTPRGLAERALVERFDGVQTVADLESWLVERFPHVFASTREAGLLLRSTIERCG